MAAAAPAEGFQVDRERCQHFFGGRYTHAGYGPRATWQEKMRRSVAAVEQYSQPLFVMDPIVVVVAGGETQGAWKMISGSLRATVSIDAWR